MKFRVAFLSLTVAALLIGCAQAPQVELDAAKAAVDTAKAAQAEMYAPEALAEVQQAMTAAEAEIAAQAEKLAFLRKYDTAKQLIAALAGRPIDDAVAEETAGRIAVSLAMPDAAYSWQERGPLVQEILRDSFYKPTAPAKAEPVRKKKSRRRPKPEEVDYQVICISMYMDDLHRLDQMVDELKARGLTKANRSALIRYALGEIDLDRVPRGI